MNPRAPGYTLNYTSSGSGAGVSEFVGGQTDFGGSDSPLSAEKGEVDKAKERCGGAEAWNLPTVFGPIAVTYNLPGVDGVALDGPTLAKIFNGAVTTWNAPEIAALNAGKTLPATRSTWCSAATSPVPRTTSRSTWRPHPTVRGEGRRQDLQRRRRRGRQGQRGHLCGDQEHRGIHHVQRVVLRDEARPAVADIVTSAGPDPVKLSVKCAGKSMTGQG